MCYLNSILYALTFFVPIEKSTDSNTADNAERETWERQRENEMHNLQRRRRVLTLEVAEASGEIRFDCNFTVTKFVHESTCIVIKFKGDSKIDCNFLINNIQCATVSW